MRCEVLKPIPGLPHKPGDVVEGRAFRNADVLITQRYLVPVGDADRLDALETRMAEIESQLGIGGSGKGKAKH